MTKLDRRYVVAVLTFGATGLVGPVIALVMAQVLSATWPPAHERALDVIFFISTVASFVWPVHPLTVAEVSIGQFRAAVYATSVNVLLFLFLGVVVATATRRPRHVLWAYIATAMLVFLMDFALTRFHLQGVHWFSLLVAFVIYSLPFYVLARSMR